MNSKHYTSMLLCASISLTAFCVFEIQHAFASETNGSIQSGYVYAWGDKLGWINFKPSQGGITITDSGISGYAWSTNDGWINFSPTTGGVTNTAAGQLGGYAWSSGKGWISFSGVNISGTGKFSGVAGTLGATAGQINFDCSQCDVRTDWRPQQLRGGAVGTRIIGGYAFGINPALPITPLPTLGESPLTLLPSQDGTIIQDSEVGPIIVYVPGKAVSEELTLHVNAKDSQSSKIQPPTADAILLNGTYYEIIVRDAKGNEVHEFDSPLRITLPLPRDLRNLRRLAVYWLDEGMEVWNKIPDAVFFDDHVEFKVTHLTKFAIFATPSSSMIKRPTVIQGPAGGAIIIDQGTVDISPQEQTIRNQREGMRGVSPHDRSPEVTQKPQAEKTSAMNLLVVITATLIAVLAHILAKQKMDEIK
ncbi:MAG TPA: hypothetical protein VJ579_04110 [Candidatus Paceibacterota bacterium]|nr:hypothetical protein [Candidatus Paceibacterota bacterium]